MKRVGEDASLFLSGFSWRSPVLGVPGSQQHHSDLRHCHLTALSPPEPVFPLLGRQSYWIKGCLSSSSLITSATALFPHRASLWGKLVYLSGVVIHHLRDPMK